MKVLLLTSYYLPGLKSGGPLRSLLHLQRWLGREYQFYVVTRDRDLGEDRPYVGDLAHKWHAVEGAQVFYLSRPVMAFRQFRRIVREVKPDVIYCQSSLDPGLTLVPLFLRWCGLWAATTPVIVAPRGELSAGALSIKSTKKRLFAVVARWMGLYRNVTWHSTSPEESMEIRRLWGDDALIALAPNLPSPEALAAVPQPRLKRKGQLRIVFLSRIARKKNLLFALGCLRNVSATIEFDIYGAKEDPGYWADSESEIAKLPSNVKVTVMGAASPGDVPKILERYEAFLLPTLGENFGHAIFEAMAAGCVPVISDRTPWRKLAGREAGFDLSLDDPSAFVAAVQALAEMDQAAYDRWSDGARAVAQEYCSNDLVTPSIRMLGSAARS